MLDKTLTNLAFLFLGIRGVRSCLSQSHDRIFLIAFGGYMLVGMGSIAFHASLKYPMQLWDELSMIYTTCLMLFASFSYARSSLFSFFLGVGLLGLSTFISIYYHVTKDPEFHQTAYAILTAIVVFHGMWVMESHLRPSLRTRHGKNGDEILKTMWAMVGTGLSVFLGGFLIWNLDNIHCGQIRRWRREIGLPWAVLLEGHGWWHLMTGLGGNYVSYPDVIGTSFEEAHLIGAVGIGIVWKRKQGGFMSATRPCPSSPYAIFHGTSDITARKPLAREIEAQAASAQQQIGIARTQITGKQREQRLVKLTLSELSGLPTDTIVYEGVGKMFAALPVTEMTQKLESQTKDLDGELEKLGQRLVYLETTHKNSREHIEKMLRNA
ncbi:hypothetical protein NQ176_g444 [Zarea fungicola]|uniref:Uncharacterized protein n=1 Tax=Zarea fungicola TaxID=93591 RepID=A0ACC1NY37_9HYPO|nr:hypothetical protein NQ176_g444 [Lecanicillium fungicola]